MDNCEDVTVCLTDKELKMIQHIKENSGKNEKDQYFLIKGLHLLYDKVMEYEYYF